MSKSYNAATVDVEWTGTKVKVKSKEFDKHNHIHMAPDKDGKANTISFVAQAGYLISGIEIGDDDGPFTIPPLPAATAVVEDTNNGKELKKYSFTVSIIDEEGNKYTSDDPKIVNDPGN